MDDLQTRIGHVFANRKLLREALTHPSCAESAGGVAFSYQRLEFLGDSVLSVVVAELLFTLYPLENEGSLAKRHAALVCSDALAQVARGLNLGVSIRMNTSESNGGGRENGSNLEDACEALIGALYLDAGFEVARHFIREHWEPLARSLAEPPRDAKTALQEWAQARGCKLPVYMLTQTTGPAHAPEFTIEVRVENHPPSSASAMSKRQAEQLAARAMLAALGDKA